MPILNVDTRWRWVANATPPPAPPPGNRHSKYALYRKLGGPTGTVWTEAENLATTGNYKPNTVSNIVT